MVRFTETECFSDVLEKDLEITVFTAFYLETKVFTVFEITQYLLISNFSINLLVITVWKL